MLCDSCIHLTVARDAATRCTNKYEINSPIFESRFLTCSSQPSIFDTMLLRNRLDVRILLVAIIAVSLLIITQRNQEQAWRTYKSISRSNAGKEDAVKIAKVTMLYGENEFLERALASHKPHNKQHGYEHHVLRRSITHGYWNKLSYLQSLIVQELSKDENERAQWLMWHDADTIILNPHIPLSIFLPPDELSFRNTHFIGSRSDKHVNSGVFFVRVDVWSIKLLVKAMAVPLIDQKAELGPAMDQDALTYILNEGEFREHAYYHPPSWFHTEQGKDGFYGKPGALLARFPGNLQGQRWKAMEDCLDDKKVHGGKWELPLSQTKYETEIEVYWERVRQAKKLLEEMQETLKVLEEKIKKEQKPNDQKTEDEKKKDEEEKDKPKPGEALRQAIQRMRDAIELWADDETFVRESMDHGKVSMEHP